jgi:lactoylglutathione lyase
MVRVRDLNESLRFYCDGLGLLEVRRKESTAGRYTLVFLAAPGDFTSQEGARPAQPQVELTFNWDAEQYTGGRNFGHLAYAVDDIYASCERLSLLGTVILRPPRDGHMAFVRSPDDISIELLQRGNPLPPREPWLSMPNTGSW